MPFAAFYYWYAPMTVARVIHASVATMTAGLGHNIAGQDLCVRGMHAKQPCVLLEHRMRMLQLAQEALNPSLWIAINAGRLGLPQREQQCGRQAAIAGATSHKTAQQWCGFHNTTHQPSSWCTYYHT